MRDPRSRVSLVVAASAQLARDAEVDEDNDDDDQDDGDCKYKSVHASHKSKRYLNAHRKCQDRSTSSSSRHEQK